MQLQKLKKNPKYFYSYAKKYSKTKPKVGPLMDPVTKSLTGDSLRMANILQEQYKSVFKTPNTQYNHPELEDSQIPEQLDDIEFT